MVSNKQSYTDEFINQIHNTIKKYQVKEDHTEHLLDGVKTEMKDAATHGGKLVRSTSLGLVEFVCGEVCD